MLLGVTWAATGRRTRPNLVLTAGTNFTITTTVSSSASSRVPALLYPGLQRYLVYTVSNPMDAPITVATLGITSVSATDSCPATNLDVSQTDFSGALVVPANGTSETEVPVSLIDSAVNQDACQNTTFRFTYSGTAAYDLAPGGGSGPGGSTTATTVAGRSPSLIRVAGEDGILTSIASSQDSFGNGEAGAVVISRSDLYPDALAGTPFAVDEDAPMLLTAPTTLDPRTEAELDRVLAKGRTVYVLGGPDAISPGIVLRLGQDGYRVVRLGGLNRYATAVVIARDLGTPNDILVTTGITPGDALAGGAAAAKLGGVVVLTDGSRMPAETTAYLASEVGVAQVALGGPAAAADPSAAALVGADRYATSVLVAQRFFHSPSVVGLANGFGFPDALSGGADMGEKGGPLLLIGPGALPQSVDAYLRSIAPTLTAGYVYGGMSVVPVSEFSQIGVAIDGS
jgi:putative cell wall-binding protein